MKNWLVCGQGPKWKRTSRYVTTARRSLFRLWIAFFPIGEVVSLRMLEMLNIIDYQRFSLIFEGNMEGNERPPPLDPDLSRGLLIYSIVQVFIIQSASISGLIDTQCDFTKRISR